MSTVSPPDPAEPDARRPGLRNRVRRLLHPHRRTVVRVSLGTIGVIAVLALVGGAIRSLGADGGQPAPTDEIDELQAAWVADLGEGTIGGIATDGDAIIVSTEQGLLRLDAACPVASDATTPSVTPSSGQPGSDGSGDCVPVWRSTEPNEPLSAPVIFDERVFAGSSEGRVFAFPVECAARCEPEWVGQAGDGQVSQAAVNDDFVYVTTDRLYAFPSRCGTGDRICAPVWSAPIPGPPPTGPPAIGGGLVVVTSSAAGGSVYAFPAVCSIPCPPVWAATTSGAPGPAAVHGDAAYVAAGGRLLAFPVSCRATCDPEWSGSFETTSTVGPGAVAPPFPQGDLVYVGADDGTLWVFPATCPGPSCAPVRSFLVSDAELTRPASLGGVVYVTSIDGALHAVAGSCDPPQTPCLQPVSVDLDAPTTAAAAVGEGAVYAGDVTGRLSAFSLRPGP